MVCTYELWSTVLVRTINSSTDSTICSMYGMSVNAAPCVSVILAPREMSVILAPLDLLSVKLTHSRVVP